MKVEEGEWGAVERGGAKGKRAWGNQCRSLVSSLVPFYSFGRKERRNGLLLLTNVKKKKKVKSFFERNLLHFVGGVSFYLLSLLLLHPPPPCSLFFLFSFFSHSFFSSNLNVVTFFGLPPPSATLLNSYVLMRGLRNDTHSPKKESAFFLKRKKSQCGEKRERGEEKKERIWSLEESRGKRHTNALRE